VRTSVRDLRFTDNPTTEQIYKNLPQFGLETCPPDVITKIINSNEFLVGDSLYIGMDPVLPRHIMYTSQSILKIESGEEDGHWHLTGVPISPFRKWNLNTEILLRLSNKAK
jgi:hypothetical protein